MKMNIHTFKLQSNIGISMKIKKRKLTCKCRMKLDVLFENPEIVVIAGRHN